MGRSTHAAPDVVPCYHSGARIWLRKRRRWLIGPEIIRGHGFSEARDGATSCYTTKELMNLMANSFSAPSIMVAFVSQMVLTTRLSALAHLDSVILRTPDVDRGAADRVLEVSCTQADRAEAQQLVREQVQERVLVS